VDDGAIADEDPIKVQASADAFTERFARVGLHMNETKTKGMVVKGAQPGTKTPVVGSFQLTTQGRRQVIQ
jgi:hypothetical protein